MIEITVKGETWTDLVKEIEDLTTGMSGGKLKAQLSNPTITQATPKAEKTEEKAEKTTFAPKVTSTSKKEKTPDKKPATHDVTLVEIRAAFKELLKADRDLATKMLSNYGVKNISALTPDQYEAVLTNIKAAL